MNERRRERLAALVREIMPEFFRGELMVPKGSLISVLYAEPSESGTRVNVFVSVYPDSARDEVARALKIGENGATRFMRSRIKTKYSPSVHFFVTDQGLA